MSPARGRAAGALGAGRRRVASAAGQGIVEFGLILALAVLVAAAILVFLRPQLAWALSMIGSEVDKSGWLGAPLAFA
jgi:hypothetical protein